jgi:hypothetical protein
MIMTAEEILTALIGVGPTAPRWVREAALLIDPPNYRPGQAVHFYKTTGVNFFPEVTIRLPVDGVTRRGKPKLQRRRLDLVGLVQSHYKSFDPFIVGVEIKVAEHDLVGDMKMEQYLEHCHLFYLAVPTELLDAAMQKIKDTPALAGCGLLAVDQAKTVGMVRKPTLYRPAGRCLAEIYAELLLRPFKLVKKDCKNFLEFERRF